MKTRFLLTVTVITSIACGFAHADNFRITNLPPTRAAAFDRAAESAYLKLSTWWFGRPHPDLWRPVPLTVDVRRDSSGGGATTFVMDQGHVFGWKMRVVGTQNRILQDAIPHEVGHVVLYAHFRRPLGRCLDEGAAAIGESAREHTAHRRRVATDLKRGRALPFAVLLDAQRYPNDAATTQSFYAQSHSLVEYLLQRKGRQTLSAFLADKRRPSEKLRDFYGHSPAELQARWEVWFRQRAQRGVDCLSFGCPYHTANKPPAAGLPTSPKRLTEAAPDSGRPAVGPVRGRETRAQQATRAQPFVRNAGEKPVIYAFTAKWCRACRPFKDDVAAGRFRGYRIEFVDPDADRQRWTAITAKMAAETGHRGDVPLPSWWVPGSKRLVVMRNGYSAPGLLQVLEAIIRGLIRLIHNPPARTAGTPPVAGEGTSVPSATATEHPAEDWTGVTIVLLAAERDVGVVRGRTRQALLGLSRGPLERKARELTGGKARLVFVPQRTQPGRYAAALRAAGLEPSGFDVVALVPQQARGLVKELVARTIETVIAGKLAGRPNVDVIFERTDPADYAAVLAALQIGDNEKGLEGGSDARAKPASGVVNGDLKQEIVFWLASIGLPMWLAERLTRHRRLAKQVENAWQRLHSSSQPSSPSSDSEDSAA